MNILEPLLEEASVSFQYEAVALLDAELRYYTYIKDMVGTDETMELQNLSNYHNKMEQILLARIHAIHGKDPIKCMDAYKNVYDHVAIDNRTIDWICALMEYDILNGPTHYPQRNIQKAFSSLVKKGRVSFVIIGGENCIN